MSESLADQPSRILRQVRGSHCGGSCSATTALSYGNIVGANDRISLGHIGIGSRGGDLDLIASKLKSSHHVEMTAVCDLWKVNREKAVATNQAITAGLRVRCSIWKNCWR